MEETKVEKSGVYRPDIASAYPNRCVEQGISVMRLALGYSTGLPDGWSCTLAPGGILLEDIFDLFNQAFPGREVRVFVGDGRVSEFSGTEPISKFLDMIHDSLGDYLLAFGYTTESVSESHFVIGFPITYNGELQAVYILAVSLLEKEYA